jgi:hypothetical protein
MDGHGSKRASRPRQALESLLEAVTGLQRADGPVALVQSESLSAECPSDGGRD